MRKENILADANEVLNRNAVTFDTHRRYNNQDAWPFMYPFVPKPYLETDVLNDGKGLLGIKVPAGAIKEIPVNLDRDSVYRLINIKYTPFRCSLGAAVESGNTMTVTAGSTTMTGVGTDFLTTMSKGDYLAWLDDNGNIQHGVVDTITSKTVLDLEQAVTQTATAVAIFLCVFKWYDTVPALDTDGEISADLTGTITTAVDSTGFVGVGTDFDAEVIAGEILTWIDDAGVRKYGKVASITNDTNIVLEDAADSVATGVAFGKLDALEGSITVAPGGAAMVGVDTEFVTDLAVGDVVEAVDADGQPRQFIIDTITDATNIVISETLAAGDPGVPAGSTFRRVGRVQTGTITADAANRLVTGGGGSLFTEELKEGDVIFYADASGVCTRARVSDIVSDTEFKSTQPLIASGAGVTYALGNLDHRANFQTFTGTIGIAASGTAVVGVGTLFTEELTVGQKFTVTDSAGANIIVKVATITDDTNIVLETAIGTDAVTAGSSFFAVSSRLPSNLFRYRPLTEFLRVSVIMSSLRGRYLYGGTQEFISANNPAEAGLQERPHLISSLQGADDGLGMLRTSMVFPWSSSVKIKVHNLYSEEIIINGNLFGYKISPGE